MQQDYDDYSDEDQQTWRRLVELQFPLLQAHACTAFQEGYALLEPHLRTIPRLEDLARLLERYAGWSVVAADGFLSAEDYFALLARRIFPVVPAIRKAGALRFTPAPDIWHDVCGHLPLLFDRRYGRFVADLSRRFAQAGERLRVAIGRLYWFTVETGVVFEAGGRKIYGSGILSGPDEIRYAAGDAAPVRPFDLAQIVATQPHYEDLQPFFVAIDSFDALAPLPAALERLLRGAPAR
ncbi:phenylalanine 4-monooxygenase [Gloeobacter kilaueensis]|uniref:Phenylalanine 4-monooxygenase n=1 Tax=Gloeobacter kilaueensis (strain ATCC BAA-2537 / CCAP 1431/1 / ULC 316 / JS1) TaxID=1183438 RepID=U5QK41_GLOK1|nr:phenylalanine 4-monooxygenase [Gloeobacter kilaueensis]AGY59317.1 phenylalanine 4-monooxygenase [Gloeobacter kilaueensis JS1]